MVGRGGRSQACLTCKRRKKGVCRLMCKLPCGHFEANNNGWKQCDLERPKCGQCRRACITCDGYTEGLSFVYTDATYASNKEGRCIQKHSKLPARLMWCLQDADRQLESTTTSSVDLLFSRPYSRASVEARLLGVFWERYLPLGQSSHAMDPTQRLLGGSISVLQSMSPLTVLLRQALVSMTLVSLAEEDSQRTDLLEQGLKLHGLALNNMIAALAKSKRHQGIELLVATRLFSFYQVGGALSA